MAENRVVLITGTRIGIGKYLAEYYVGKGFQVIGCSRHPADYELNNYKHFCLSVDDEPAAKQMFSAIRKTYNRLDILINNAGTISTNYALLTPFEVAQNIISTNFLGTFLFSREAVKIMQKNKYGRIINISSVAVPLCRPGTSVYSASKAAVEQFSKVLAKEVEPLGVTVNTIGLSFVKNSGMAEGMDGKIIKDTLSLTSSNTLLELEEVSRAIDAIIYQADSVTGQTVYLGQ